MLQFVKDTGADLLRTLMRQIQALVSKLQDLETNSLEPAATENLQEGSDLFLEINQSSAVETDKERVKKKVIFIFNIVQFVQFVIKEMMKDTVWKITTN